MFILIIRRDFSSWKGKYLLVESSLTFQYLFLWIFMQIFLTVGKHAKKDIEYIDIISITPLNIYPFMFGHRPQLQGSMVWFINSISYFVHLILGISPRQIFKEFYTIKIRGLPYAFKYLVKVSCLLWNNASAIVNFNF